MTKLFIEDFFVLFGFLFIFRIRFVNFKMKKKGVFESLIVFESENDDEDNVVVFIWVVKKDFLGEDLEEEDFFLRLNEEGKGVEKLNKDEGVFMYVFYIMYYFLCLFKFSM